MKLYFDENFSKQLVEGFKAFQSGRPDEKLEVIYLCDEFGRGCADEEWIPKIGKQSSAKNKCVVLTQDTNIHRSQVQAELYQEHGVSFFFFYPPKKRPFKYWEWIEKVMKHWSEIKTILNSESKPFAYSIKPSAAKSQKMGNH